ncbi:MAG: site-2 protease family protein [Gammaproteobacteria bacterium]|nr:site-2 protease family protein [Gammaproteobacteria bacterium]
MPENQISDVIRLLSVAAIPILFGITVHEVAHGWMARLFGDRTAEMLGRLTLNPIKHIDPVGTVIVPLLMLWFSGFLFGWAKPVPIGAGNLRNPKRDMVAVALAGPGANLLMALGWALLYKLIALLGGPLGGGGIFFLQMARIGVFFNLLLMIFNLLPIPPLDGGRVLRGLVPETVGRRLDALERYGLIIVVGLLVFGLLGPVIFFVRRITASLGIPPI